MRFEVLEWSEREDDEAMRCAEGFDGVGALEEGEGLRGAKGGEVRVDDFDAGEVVAGCGEDFFWEGVREMHAKGYSSYS